MFPRKIATALILTAATMALSGGGCSSGGGGNKFIVQTWSDAAPNRNLDEFLADADAGEKISITQHTGTMTVSVLAPEDFEDIIDIVDFLFFDGDVPVPEAATVEATADGNDETPAHLELTDSMDFDFIFDVDSTGELQMLIVEDNGSLLAAGVKDVFEGLDVGDDVGILTATNPGVDGPFGVLDYMSVVAWVTFEFPADNATEATFEYGLGHMGLVTPEADVPTEGDADYAGDFVGIYVEPGFDEGGSVYVATGDAAFTADFGLGTVEGGVFGISLDGTANYNPPSWLQ